MKTLNKNEMETLNGGGFWAVLVAVVTIVAVADAGIEFCKGVVDGYNAAASGH